MIPANIRDEFPILNRKISNDYITYLDSAAISLKPLTVIEAEVRYGTELTANVHRGHNVLSEELSYQYEIVRQKTAEFINSTSDCVIFTPNTTYALNMVAYGLNLKKNDKILCSRMNHNSNLLPWMNASEVVYFEVENLDPLPLDLVTEAIKTYRPKVLAISYVSNVNGVIHPVTEICKIAHEYGVITVIDAAQAIAHLPINVEKLGCDFLAFSGHKMLGPTGTGILYGRYELLDKLRPMILGGGMINTVTSDGYTLKPLPYRLEPGTPNISGILGLGAAIDYIKNIDYLSIKEHENKLMEAMNQSLTNLPRVKVLGGKVSDKHIAIASIIPLEGNIHSDQLCQILSDSFNIMTRSGFHCANTLFNYYEYRK